MKIKKTKDSIIDRYNFHKSNIYDLDGNDIIDNYILSRKIYNIVDENELEDIIKSTAKSIEKEIEKDLKSIKI